MHDDAGLVLVLVKTNVGEELAHAVNAEGVIGERVAGLRSGAALDLVGVHGDGAGSHPWSPRDHALPTVLDRLHATIVEAQVRLVVHAVQTLHDGLLQLVDHLCALTRLGVDLVDALVVDLDLQILGPAAIAAQPAAGAGLGRRALHGRIVCGLWPGVRLRAWFVARGGGNARRA